MLGVARRIVALVGPAMLLAAAAQAQNSNYTQFDNHNVCALSRADWMAVAESPPGFGWAPSPEGRTDSSLQGANATMDAIRISSPRFRQFCCTAAVYRDPSTGHQVIAVQSPGPPGLAPAHPGPSFQVDIPLAPCCEDAALAINADPLNCTSVPLVSVPGAIVVMSVNGPVAMGGPVTIATDPPTVVAGLHTHPQRGGGTYLGCYRDPNNPFNLDGHLERSAQNTPQRCIEICKGKGFRFAGVEYGESCLCGNSYDQFGAADNCDMACTGDAGQICGGINATSVYATGP
jgi:hypothetical protein